MVNICSYYVVPFILIHIGWFDFSVLEAIFIHHVSPVGLRNDEIRMNFFRH